MKNESQALTVTEVAIMSVAEWMVLLLVTAALTSQGARTGSCQIGCPSRCQCSMDVDSGCMVDCSNKNLPALPSKFPRNTTVINLHNNEIKKLPARGFINVPELIALRIDENQLQSVHVDAFKGLTLLKSLNLRFNELVKSSVMNYTGYLDETLKDLESLEILYLDGANNTVFGPGYSKLNKLRIINLSGSSTTCLMYYVPELSFQHTPNVQVLNISKCNVERIHSQSFGYLRRLQTLDMSFNGKMGFESMGEALYSLRNNTSLRSLNISGLYKTFGLGTELKVSHVANLQHTLLEEVIIDSNRLELFETGVSSILPKSITYGSIKDNKFTYGSYIFESPNLENLREIDMSFLFTSHLFFTKGRYSKYVGSQKEIEHLKETPKECIFTKYQSISKVDRNQSRRNKRNIFSTKKRSISTNSFSSREKALHHKLTSWPVFDSKLITINIARNLVKIHFRECKLNYRLFAFSFGKNKVKFLNVSGNLFASWEGPIRGIDKIEILDLSNNMCTFVSVNFFVAATGLRELYIHDNFLGISLPTSINGFENVFRNQYNLEKLKISNNRISRLSFNVFSNQKNMRSLDLSFNQLSLLNFSIHHMKNLSYLDVSNNLIPYLSRRTREDLDELWGRNKLVVNLMSNRLQCTCETRDFLHWLLRSSAHFKDFENMTCFMSNQTVLSLKELGHIVTRLDKRCSSYLPLILGTLALIVTAITVISGGLVYRYRWNLRYFYHVVKERYRGQRAQINEDFVYDAFISYADEDRFFVINEMRRRLEQQENFKLCIHHRDFLAGEAIADNIISAIKNSRKTVIILSSDFLSSYWCKYEYNMARLESIHSGRELVVIVMLKSVPVENVPMELLAHIRSNSYIEYTDDPQGEQVFWNSVRRTIVE